MPRYVERQGEIICHLILHNTFHSIHEGCIWLKRVDILCLEGIQDSLCQNAEVFNINIIVNQLHFIIIGNYWHYHES